MSEFDTSSPPNQDLSASLAQYLSPLPRRNRENATWPRHVAVAWAAWGQVFELQNFCWDSFQCNQIRHSSVRFEGIARRCPRWFCMLFHSKYSDFNDATRGKKILLPYRHAAEACLRRTFSRNKPASEALLKPLVCQLVSTLDVLAVATSWGMSLKPMPRWVARHGRIIFTMRWSLSRGFVSCREYKRMDQQPSASRHVIVYVIKWLRCYHLLSKDINL